MSSSRMDELARLILADQDDDTLTYNEFADLARELAHAVLEEGDVALRMGAALFAIATVSRLALELSGEEF